MKRGGYQILDMSDFPITTSTGYRIKNLYDSIVESNGKAFLLTGINYNSEDIGDRFVTFVLSNNIYYGLLSVSNNGIAMFVKVEPDDDVSIITKTLGGGGSNVTITPTLESGTEIATITVDGEEYTLYAPTPQTVAVTSVLQSGTQIATITIDQTTYTLYAPEGGGSGTSYGSITGSMTTDSEGGITFISDILDQSNLTDKPYFIYSIGIPNIRFFVPILPILSISEYTHPGIIRVLYRSSNDSVEFKDYQVYIDSFIPFGTGYQLQMYLAPISEYNNTKLYHNSITYGTSDDLAPATISIDTSGTDPRITINTYALTTVSDITNTTFIEYSAADPNVQGKRTEAHLVVTPAFRELIMGSSSETFKYKYHGKVFGYIHVSNPSSPFNIYYSGFEYDEMAVAEATSGTIIVKATDVHSM